MKLWLCWTLLALAASSAQRIAQDDAETLLEAAATLKENIFNRLRSEETTNASCILEGIKDRKLSIFQLHRLSQGQTFRLLSERLCGSQDQWLTDLHYIEEEFKQETLTQLTTRQQSVLDQTCGSFTDAVVLALTRGNLAASKKLITGLLTHIRYPITTPDVITLFENVVKILENSNIQVERFRVTGTDVVENLLQGVLAQNELQPHENYQFQELISTLDNIRPIKEMNLLLLMKPDSYPKDVIEARDKLLAGLGYGGISGEPTVGWPEPPQQLLALLTSLTANPNDNEYVPYAHVLFGYFRLRYLTMMGYEFVPSSLADIAFLLNSFLTVRHPILLREVYFEFAKIPWQPFIKNLDFSQYSEPRVLFLDMLKAIMQHPEGLKLCNKLIFHYFINGDDCPNWLQILPHDFEQPRPIEVQPGNIPKPPPPASKCPGEDTSVIDPDCLIEILGSSGHASFIQDLIRFNPGTAEKYPYNTREAVYQAILNDLKEIKFKDDEVNQFVVSQAIARLPLNDNKLLPPVYVNMCPSDIAELNSHEPTPVAPEETSHTSPHFKTGSLGEDEPGSSEECTEAPGCKKIPVIDQTSLINIISESRTNTIKNVVLLKPVFYKDYQDLDTRQQVLLKVLSDRENELEDEILHFIIPQAIERMKISWEGTLPPIVEEVCEEDLKYNVKVPEHSNNDGDDSAASLSSSYPTCADEKTIDAISLIDILSDQKNTYSVQKLVFESPILAKDYTQYSTRSGVLKAVAFGRCEAKDEWQLTYDVRKIFGRVPFNWKQNLPLEYLDTCTPTTSSPESQISPSELFTSAIPGLNEKPIPCDSTTPMPLDNDMAASEEVTEAMPVTNAPTPEWSYLLSPTAPSPAASVGVSADSPNGPQEYLKSDEYENPASTEGDSTGTGSSSSPTPGYREGSKGIPDENEAYPSSHDGSLDTFDDSDEFEDCEDGASSIGAGVAELGGGSNENGASLGDSLLSSILDTVKLPKPKRKCRPKHQPKTQCGSGEVMTDIVKIDSLWDALTPESPRAPYVRNKVSTFVVPIDRSRDYTKAEVLKDILLSIREEQTHEGVIQNIDQLIKCIRFEGPGIQPPEVDSVCLQNSLLSQPAADPLTPSCKQGEIIVTVVQTDTLHSALSPSAPKTPYIRNRVNGYIVPVDRSKVYTKGEVLRDILLSLKEEMTDVRVAHNIDILIKFIRNDGPALEEPDMVDICLAESLMEDSSASPGIQREPASSAHPTHPPILGVEPPRPVNDIPPVNHQFPSSPVAPQSPRIPSSDSSISVSASDPDLPSFILPAPSQPVQPQGPQAPETPSQQSYDYPTPADESTTPTSEEALYDSVTSAEQGEVTQPPQKVPSYEQPGDSSSVSSSNPVPENVQERSPELSTTIPSGESTACPCAQDQALMKVIDNKSITNLLTDDHLAQRLNELIAPASKYVNKSRRQVLEALLTELMLKQHEVFSALLSCQDDGADAPAFIFACVPRQYAYEYTEDVYVCPSSDYDTAEIFSNRQMQCPCPSGQQYLQVVHNSAIIEMLSPADSHLQERLATLVLPAGKYSNVDRRGILENALREVMLRDYETAAVLQRCPFTGSEPPRIMASCVSSEFAELFPQDIISCPETTTVRVPKKSSCHRPVDVLVPSSLLESVFPDALQKAKDMVEIIMNSSLERAKYEQLGCRANIITELLREMREIAMAKLQAMESVNKGDVERVRLWVQQLDVLSGGIRYEGIGNEPPLYINTCVQRSVTCNSFNCESTPPPMIEDHTMLQEALFQAAQNVGPTTPSPSGKHKVKKTHIIYTTKETINVSIQGSKATNPAVTADEDVSKITDIMQAEQKQPDGRVADQVGQALDIAGQIINRTCKTSPSMHWPLLLKPLSDEHCWDMDNKINSHPVQIVNITQLLDGAEGGNAQIYIASARLAGIETFQKLSTFDMTAFKNKADFLASLTAHLAIKLPVDQQSMDEISVTTTCNQPLYEALPPSAVMRPKRQIKDADVIKELEEAMRRGNELLLNLDFNL